MKNKFIIGLLCFSLMFSVCSCNKENKNDDVKSDEEVEETEETEKSTPIETVSMGESIETNILRLTLTNAQLCIKLNSSATGTYEQIQSGNVTLSRDYFTADEYDPSTDAGVAYVAPIGHTYVAIEYYAENLDRASVDFDGFNSQLITVEYNGETYSVSTVYGAESTNGYEWDRYNSSNVLLLAGESAQMRCYVDIPVDVEDLNDDFSLVFSLPVSDGSTTDFRYEITAADIAEVESQEISVDEAVANFTDSDGYEYFSNHMNDFELISGSEISSNIIGRRWNIDIRLSYGYWSGAFRFDDVGTIQETISTGDTGYFNNRTWSIDGDLLTLSSDSTSASCEVRQVSDGVYLLISDGAPYAILH